MHRFRTLLLATSVLIPFGLSPAAANPLEPQVVGGSATVQGQGTATVTVTQRSNSAIINWNTFNIGAGEKTNIVMPSASSVELDRVTGNLGPSQISGSLWSNGRVFLVNPDGILFGSGAAVDTAGFLATTHDIANADFMAGRYNFSIPGNPSASIVNQGTITAQSGGFAALVAPGVRNSGTITATLGTVALASGNSFTLDFYGDKLITLGVEDSIAATVKDVATGQPLKSLVTNDGKLSANGGRVELTAAAARTVVDSVINNTGVIEANSIGSKNGMIVLSAATASSKPAGTQTVKVSGTLSAAGKATGTKGGKIQITGENIAVTGATIDASGVAGGGKVLIGGDVGGGHPNPLVASMAQAQLEANPVPTATTVSIDAATTIDASATGAGDGGKVVVWSDGTTNFNGNILARGDDVAGNGGFVEVSGHDTLNFYGTTDTSAATGVSGLTLLDPANFTINSDNVGSILSSLASGNVLISTVGTVGESPGDIFVNAAMTWSSTSALTLQSANNIAINSAISAINGGLSVNAQNAITALGAINVARFELQQGAWTQLGTLPSFAAQDFRIDTGALFLRALGGDGLSSATAYQITDVYGLQGIGSSPTLLSKNYVLANNIDASGTSNWNSGAGFMPIASFGQFTGQLDGQGRTISNLFIAPTANNISLIGLFGRIAPGAVVQNLNLTNVNIHANPNLGTAFQNVGALAGMNFGLIDHVTASGTINGGAVTGIFAGGLVGQNGFFNGTVVTGGTVQNSSAAVNVTLGDGVACTGQPCANARINSAGGLVGHNIATITNSSASGTIVVGANAQAGGLVGLLGFVGPNQTSAGALIDSSFATGSVFSAGVNVQLGGLVGTSAPSALITSSYATGSVTATAALALAPNGVDCSIAGNCQYENVGGLVGQNSGTIQGAVNVPLLNQPCILGQTCATGAVSVGPDGHAGGLVGNNNGIIANAFATGTVTGAAGLSNLVFLVPNLNTTRLGGLVGINQGLITDSHATGDVGTLSVANIHVGGLAGGNNGKIMNSYATGNVNAGDNSPAGGLTGLNITNAPSCSGCISDDGYAYLNVGLIINSYATGNVTVGAGSVAGGLVGISAGTITGSWASGNVGAGDNANAGGLVGVNDGSVQQSYAIGAVSGSGGFDDLGGLVGWNLGSVSQSYATGAVSSAAVNVELGGLVGNNAPGATITSSYATGNVTATAAIASNFGVDCSAPNSNCQHASVGGLVGQNDGTIQGAAVAPSLNQPCVAGQTCATGAVSVGSHVSGGGLVGFNDGIIVNAFATGAVTGAAGLDGDHGSTNLGGLAATNIGLITGSFATGDVGTPGFANLQMGGLVGDNSGTIDHSFATGNVRAGDNSSAGGLTSDNSDGFLCNGCTHGDGYAYLNTAFVSNSYATGNVTVGAASLAGGLTGSSDGTFNNSYATGAVSGGGNSILGGLAGVTNITATIANSTASGAVSSTGPNSWIGGFIGLNGGAISLSSASGPVTGTSDSLLGGFVGYNLGIITDSTASATVTGTGANNFDGGFVGVNFGLIDPSTAAGAVTGGANNVVGGFAGANASFINVPAALQIPGSTFPVGTVSADSHATGVATGGANSTVGAQVGTNYPTALPASPSVVDGCNNGTLCTILQTDLTLAPPPAPTPLPVPDTQITQLISPVDNDLTIPAPILASLTTPSSPAGSPPAGAGASSNATPGKPGFIPPPLPRRSVPGPNGETRSSVPPPGETRFFENHVLLQLDLNIPDAELTRITQQLGLRIITSDTMTTLGRKVIRLELPPGLSVRNAIRRLEANRLVSVAAPVYQFRLVQAAVATSKGDPAQYMLGNLHLDKAHVIATGKGVTIALIDSEVDKRHTELQGAIPEELDTLDVKEPPHSHGTAMAGAIVSHDRLLGVAPGATILAVRAFGRSNNTSEGTTLSILKGIDWAVSQGARVINMSFAGPRDPSLERALKAAHDKGIVLIAAAGNAGPKSPPLYPGADPSVIAVTATDVHDRVFRGANQGPQLSVAAPGVEILAPAPEESYQMSTGTSIATAHVSGVVALMLERDPTLKPDDVRKILESTATDLGPRGKDNQFGWGLINPEGALEAVAARLKSSEASSKSR